MTYEQIATQIAHELPGCPKALLLDRVAEAGRTFAREAENYRVDLDPIDLVGDEDEYTLTAPAGFVIRRVQNVTVNGLDLKFSQYAYDALTAVLTLETTPSAAATGGLEVEVILVPSAARQPEVVRGFLTPVNLVKDQAAYTLSNPTGYTIRSLLTVTVNGTELASDAWSFVSSTRVLTLVTAPTANATAGLVVTAWLVGATTAAADMTDAYVDQWAEGIAALAKHLLMRQKGKRWSDMDGATLAQRDYRRSLGAARREADAGHKNCTMRVQRRVWV